MKGKLLIAASILVSINLTAYEVYIVKNNETLTDIIHAKKLRPLYGKGGTLQRTLELNPAIQKSNGNKIFPKMKIILASGIGSTVKETVSRPAKNETHLSDSIEAQKEAIIFPSPDTSDVNRLPSDNFKQTFYWKISPSISWKSFSSDDNNNYRSSSIRALSNTNYGMSATYGMHLEENVDIYSKFFLESVHFIQDNSINLVKKTFLASSFGMGAIYQKKWMLEVAMSDEFFLTSPTVSTVEVKKINLPEIKTSYLNDFYNYQNASFSYSLSGKAFLPRTSPDINSKLSFGAGGEIGARLHNQSFKIGYELSLLKADSNSTKVQNIYWNFILENL